MFCGLKIKKTKLKNGLMRNKLLAGILIFFVIPFGLKAQEAPVGVFHYSDEMLQSMDTDLDGLSDYDEKNIYKTNAKIADTDGDSYSDGIEVKAGYDPNVVSDEKAVKSIKVSLSEQTLTYFLGPYAIKTFKISSGLKRTPTPKGEFSILKKRPLVTYGSKTGSYYYPNTKWNLLFKYGSKGNLYIHGAYWHDKFGQPMSHGCINVSYEDVEELYNWADEGVKVTIQ